MKTDTLADWLHAWTYDDRPVFSGVFNSADPVMMVDKTGRQRAAKLDLRMAIRKAERVVLDDAFIAEMAKKTIAQPPEMLAMSGLAMLPWEKMLVEYDDGARIRAVAAAAKEVGGTYEYDPGEDYGRAGLLFERTRPDDPSGWRVSHVSDSPGSLPVWPFGAEFEMHGGHMLNATGPAHPFIQNLRASGWGYVDDGDTSRTQYAIHEELMQRGAAMIEGRFTLPILDALIAAKDALPDRNIANRILQEAALQSSGKLRWGVAILAALNAVPTVRVPRVAKGTFSHARHTVSRLSTTHVRIDAAPGHEVAVYDKHFHEATGRHNRRHEVRGHWRVVDTRRKGASSSPYWMCAHQIADEDGLYALCGKCGHLLRWIDHHERGDASLGYVIKDGYDVKG